MKRLPLSLAFFMALAVATILAPSATAAGLTTFTSSKSAVAGGMTISTTFRLAAPAPSGGQQVTFAASNSYSTAPVPVTIAAGRTFGSARFKTRAVERDISVTLTATTDGVDKALTVVLTPAKLSSLSTPSLLVAGTSKTGTVNLDAYAQAPIVVSLSSSDASVASVPSSVTVPIGKRSVTFQVSTTTSSRGTTTISASANGLTKTDTSRVDVAQLLSVGITRTMESNDATTGKVRLTGLAPAGGLTVELSVPLGSPLTVPATVTVPAGLDVQSFPVASLAPAAPVKVTVTGSLSGVVKRAYVTVTAPVTIPTLVAVIAVPEPVGSNSDVVIGVALSAPVSSGAVQVALTSNNQSVLPLSQTVSVTAGNDAYILLARTRSVSTATQVTINASSNGTTVSTTITVKPFVVFDLVLPTTSLVGPRTASGTVQLTGPAPTGGAQVVLTSGNALVSVPNSVTVPAGAMTATFPLTIGQASARTVVTITATANSSSVSEQVTVGPIGVLGFNLNNSSITGGNSGGIGGNLNADPPAGGVVVTLTSSHPSVLQVPATVTVTAAGSYWGDYTTSPVSAATTVTVTARLNGTSFSSSLVVLPPQLSTMSFPENRAVAGVSYTARVGLSAPAQFATTVTLTSAAPGVLTVPASVVIPVGSREVSFTISAGPVTQPQTVRWTATANGVTQRMDLPVYPVGPKWFGDGGYFDVDEGTVAVVLTGPAPAGGLVVALSYQSNLSGQSSITVPAGATSVDLPIGAYILTSGANGSLTATANGQTATGTAVINAAAASYDPVALEVTGGQSASATIRFGRIAGPGGFSAILSSTDPDVVANQEVTVPAGADSVTVSIPTSEVADVTVVTMWLSPAGGTARLTLTVEPVVGGAEIIDESTAEEATPDPTATAEPTTTPEPAVEVTAEPTVEVTPEPVVTEEPAASETPMPQEPVEDEAAT